MLDLFTIGFPTAFSLHNLAFCALGVFLGTFLGVLPGIGPLTAVSLLFPITFYLEPVTSLIMLAGIYYGSEYGGSTASILLNLPGTAASAVTTLDGYPMTRQGRAGPALFIVTLSSFVGGTIGILLIMFLAVPIASAALGFSSADFFAVVLLALVAAGTSGQGEPLKGMAMIVAGLLLGCVGTDVNSGVTRYSFGFFELFDGISIVVVAIALFGVTEIVSALALARKPEPIAHIPLRSLIPTRDDMRRFWKPSLRGTAWGSALGILPGAGPTLAAFISYSVEKKFAKDPSRFGRGAVEGIAAPEAANNAACQTAFIPTLTLGVPGSATMAVLLGALMVHGIIPGPRIMQTNPDLVWGLIASFWIGNLLLLVLNIPLVGLWVQLLRTPYRLLFPCVIAFVCVGVYMLETSPFDIWMVLVLSLLSYGMRLIDLPPAPFLIAFILGPMVEEEFRRAMVIARGDFLALFASPVSAVALTITAGLLLWQVRAFVQRNWRAKTA